MQIKDIKSESQIWKYVNKERGRRSTISKSITKENWKEHINELLHGKSEVEEGAGRKEEPLKEETFELEDEEIERQIKKLKNGKAAGEDNVKNEAWLFSEGEA